MARRFRRAVAILVVLGVGIAISGQVEHSYAEPQNKASYASILATGDDPDRAAHELTRLFVQETLGPSRPRIIDELVSPEDLGAFDWYECADVTMYLCEQNREEVRTDLMDLLSQKGYTCEANDSFALSVSRENRYWYVTLSEQKPITYVCLYRL